MPRKVRVTLALDNQKEFVKGFESASVAVKGTKEELASVKKQYEGNLNSMEALSRQHSILEKSVDQLSVKQKAALRDWMRQTRPMASSPNGSRNLKTSSLLRKRL